MTDQSARVEEEEVLVPRTLAGWPLWAVYTPRVPVMVHALLAKELEREKHVFQDQRWGNATRGAK